MEGPYDPIVPLDVLYAVHQIANMRMAVLITVVVDNV